ncbi:hypothetical protein RND81_08G157700 [Saponaria officinalis]|uniref:Uncharacterized protein n=1 Tax=Saponaria officinalis TaxID=3572 RepID=A0AAW1J8H2_SAPOF
MKPINTRRPSKLDLNAPLLSARRSNIAAMSSLEITRSGSLNGSCHRVPFLWEQTPGKPKDSAVVEDSGLPLPKPPPVSWQSERDTSDELEEREYDDSDDGGFSDAIDLFSLAGSLNTASERLEEEDDDNETDNDDKNEMLSPSFMIERFLPAATALAASSLSALAGDKQVKPMCGSTRIVTTKEGSCVPKVARKTYSSPKKCGLEMLFPWRVKHRVCGIKSPVRQPRPRLKP